jgi:hypothetical protein
MSSSPHEHTQLRRLLKKAKDFEVRRLIRLVKASSDAGDRASCESRLARAKSLDVGVLASKLGEGGGALAAEDSERRILTNKQVAAFSAEMAQSAAAASDQQPKPAAKPKTLACGICTAMFGSDEARDAHRARRHHAGVASEATTGDRVVDELLGLTSRSGKVNRLGQRERKRRAMEEEKEQERAGGKHAKPGPKRAKGLQSGDAEEPLRKPVRTGGGGGKEEATEGTAKERKLHPSWEAKKKLNAAAAVKFQGRRMALDGEDAVAAAPKPAVASGEGLAARRPALPAPEEALHPSWQAKRKVSTAVTLEFAGSKVSFDDD